MKTLTDEITASALRPFYEREKTLPTPKMSTAELASFKADVQRIASMLGELNSPAAKIAAHLGFQNAGNGVEGVLAESRAAASLAGAGSVKRPNTSAPSAPSSTKSWAMRRFS